MDKLVAGSLVSVKWADSSLRSLIIVLSSPWGLLGTDSAWRVDGDFAETYGLSISLGSVLEFYTKEETGFFPCARINGKIADASGHISPIEMSNESDEDVDSDDDTTPPIGTADV